MSPKIDAGVCERLITAATSHCTAATPFPAPVIQTVHEPNWEGVTTALASLSTAITWGLFVLAAIALLGSIGFAIFVRQWAKEEARNAAEEWLEKEGRSILRSYEDFLKPDDGGLGVQAAQQDADNLGENA